MKRIACLCLCALLALLCGCSTAAKDAASTSTAAPSAAYASFLQARDAAMHSLLQAMDPDATDAAWMADILTKLAEFDLALLPGAAQAGGALEGDIAEYTDCSIVLSQDSFSLEYTPKGSEQPLQLFGRYDASNDRLEIRLQQQQRTVLRFEFAAYADGYAAQYYDKPADAPATLVRCAFSGKQVRLAHSTDVQKKPASLYEQLPKSVEDFAGALDAQAGLLQGKYTFNSPSKG